jgi:hypothetical protein
MRTLGYERTSIGEVDAIKHGGTSDRAAPPTS